VERIEVQDASEAVEEKVKQKLKGSGGWRKMVASRAARAASGIASPPMIASMLGEKLPPKMIDLMEEKGITVAVDEVFREGKPDIGFWAVVSSTSHTHALVLLGPYVVFSVQVIKVDAVVLANSKRSKSESEGISFFHMSSLVGVGLGIIGSNNQQWVEEGYLPKIVQKKLEKAMGEILAEKLEKKKMVAETYVLGEAKQARYFFAKYREVQSLKPVGFSGRIRNSTTSQGPSGFRRSSSSVSADVSPDADSSDY
jgi:hypothetical protein